MLPTCTTRYVKYMQYGTCCAPRHMIRRLKLEMSETRGCPLKKGDLAGMYAACTHVSAMLYVLPLGTLLELRVLEINDQGTRFAG